MTGGDGSSAVSVRRWKTPRSRLRWRTGRQVYLLADTNEVAARLAGRIRDHLVAAGGVDDTRTVTLDDGNRVGLGDEVVTRDNDRFNRTGDGRFVANRDTWTVTAISDIGGVRVARPDTGDTVELEPGYVAEQVQLSYAGTIHAATSLMWSSPVAPAATAPMWL